MLSLRCRLGIDKQLLKNYGYDIENNENFVDFKKKGVLIDEGNIVKLNPDFYGVSNFIIASILP